MAYEAKALLLSLYKLAERAKDLEDMKQLIKDIANAEGVVIPLRDARDAKDAKDKITD